MVVSILFTYTKTFTAEKGPRCSCCKVTCYFGSDARSFRTRAFESFRYNASSQTVPWALLSCIR